ncbi:MAG TPA: cupredoxin domain-containing protein [Actinomycetota bacterium]|nr:cupredoxin domain-containing protein [Actinomycetota bacterium]
MRKLFAGLVMAVVALTACGGGSDSTSGTTDAGGGGGKPVTVTAKDFAFSPNEITVDPGEEVELTFQNDDTTTHTFTSDDIDVDLSVDGGKSGTATFTAPDSGTVEWHCSIHSSMTGTIKVGDAGADSGSDDSGSDSKDSGSDY